jgi:hypothetical protein
MDKESFFDHWLRSFLPVTGPNNPSLTGEKEFLAVLIHRKPKTLNRKPFQPEGQLPASWPQAAAMSWPRDSRMNTG